jgi:hypothetical protein
VASTLEIPKPTPDDMNAGEKLKLVNPTEFRTLAVSNRRMERADDVRDFYRGLRDLDTGEVFLVEERRLRAH